MNAQVKEKALAHASKIAKVPAVTTDAAPKAPRPKAPYITYLTELIEEAKMTQKELQEAGWKKFPDVSKATITTVLVDSKNPKYNRFPHLVVKDEKGILTFKK